MRPGLGTPGWKQAMSNYHQGTPAFRAARLPSRLLCSRLRLKLCKQGCFTRRNGPIPNLKSGCGNFLTDVDSSASSSRKKGTAMFGAVKALLSHLAGDPGPRTRANYHNRRLARLLASIGSSPHHRSTTSRSRCSVWLIVQFDFTGSVRNRSLEVIKGGSSITGTEVC